MTALTHEHSQRRHTINPQGPDASLQMLSRATTTEPSSVHALAQMHRSLNQSPRVAQLTQLSAIVQKRARPGDLAGEDERPVQLVSADAHVAQRESWDDDPGDDDELTEEERAYLPPRGATLWDFIEPVLMPAVQQAEARAQALKEEADRAEAQAKALRDAEAEAQAREQARIAAEELERARAAAEAMAQAEALAKQKAEQEAREKADEALKLAQPTPANRSRLGPNRATEPKTSVTPTPAKKKRFKGTPMTLAAPDIGVLMGRQAIANHPVFVLNLFYPLNNNPGFNELHVHLDVNNVVVYVSKKTTGQAGNGTLVPPGSALFNLAAARAAQDR